MNYQRLTIITFLLLLVVPELQYAQKFEGNWLGKMSVSGQEMEIGFHIEFISDSVLSASFDFYDQAMTGIKVDKISTVEDTIILAIKKMGTAFTAVLCPTSDTLNGSWKNENSIVSLIRVEKLPGINRPQEPIPPFPYKEEAVSFYNKKAGITLSGTLTLPNSDGPFAALILVSGSGAQNRDEEIFMHKPFKLISDYLTRAGFAVLRYDDRGTGQSEGDFSVATSSDFADDAEAAFLFLKSRSDIDHSKIGLAGHSEGGLVIPMVANRHKDVAFLISLAGMGMQGSNLIILQTELIARADNMPEDQIQQSKFVNQNLYDIVLKEKNNKKAAENIRKFFDEYNAKQDSGLRKYSSMEVAGIASQLTSPWLRYFLAADPAKYYSKVKCPVLALNGSKDLQVPADENLGAIKAALLKSKNNDFTTMKIEGLNHLFQHCQTGKISEYARIEETFAPEALEAICSWLKQRF